MALTKVGKEGITGISNASDATAITITSGELVGIGTTSPAHNVEIVATASGSVNDTLQIRNNATASGTGSRIRFINSTDANSDTNGASIASIRTGNDNDLAFETENAERMRINSSGNVFVGKTATGIGTEGIELRSNKDVLITKSGETALYLNRLSSDGNLVELRKDNASVGSISVNGSSTAYNTSSDYRLKENVDYTWDATTRLKQLKPARFNFIADDTNTPVDGFLAHEVSSIVPEAITGTKDAMTAQVLYAEGDELPDGKSVGDVKEPSVIKPQGIDQSKLVPLLVKTIQELEARITALEA